VGRRNGGKGVESLRLSKGRWYYLEEGGRLCDILNAIGNSRFGLAEQRKAGDRVKRERLARSTTVHNNTRALGNPVADAKGGVGKEGKERKFLKMGSLNIFKISLGERQAPRGVGKFTFVRLLYSEVAEKKYQGKVRSLAFHF